MSVKAPPTNFGNVNNARPPGNIAPGSLTLPVQDEKLRLPDTSTSATTNSVSIRPVLKPNGDWSTSISSQDLLKISNPSVSTISPITQTLPDLSTKGGSFNGNIDTVSGYTGLHVHYHSATGWDINTGRMNSNATGFDVNIRDPIQIGDKSAQQNNQQNIYGSKRKPPPFNRDPIYQDPSQYSYVQEPSDLENASADQGNPKRQKGSDGDSTVYPPYNGGKVYDPNTGTYVNTSDANQLDQPNQFDRHVRNAGVLLSGVGVGSAAIGFGARTLLGAGQIPQNLLQVQYGAMQSANQIKTSWNNLFGGNNASGAGSGNMQDGSLNKYGPDEGQGDYGAQDRQVREGEEPPLDEEHQAANQELDDLDDQMNQLRENQGYSKDQVNDLDKENDDLLNEMDNDQKAADFEADEGPAGELDQSINVGEAPEVTGGSEVMETGMVTAEEGELASGAAEAGEAAGALAEGAEAAGALGAVGEAATVGGVLADVAVVGAATLGVGAIIAGVAAAGYGIFEVGKSEGWW